MSPQAMPSVPDYGQLARNQQVANTETGVGNIILNNPNVKAPGYQQTTTFNDVPDYGAYVNSYDDLKTHFTQGRADGSHDFTDIADFGRDHYQKYGKNEGRNLTYGQPTDVYGVPQPSTEITLDPQQQDQWQTQQDIYSTLGDVGYDQLGKIQSNFNRPITSDWLVTPDRFLDRDLDPLNTDITSNLYDYTVDPSVQGHEATADALRQREALKFAEQRRTAESDLAARGFSPGGSGYDGRMNTINQQQNDFNLGATLAAGDVQQRLFDMEGQRRGQDLYENKSQFETDLKGRQQGFFENEKQYGVDRDFRDMQINEYLAERNLPLSDLNSLIHGIPQTAYTGVPYTGATMSSAPLFDAGLAQYQSEVGNAQRSQDNFANNAGIATRLAGVIGGWGK